MIRTGPSCALPTDNEYGIPVLRLDRQGEFARPLRTWGNVGRGTPHRGTYSLYCDDYRFQGLLQEPERLVASGCPCAIEPNISVFDDHPLAWAIWATHEKRRVARTWQDRGVNVFVDLCVPAQFMAINLLGVPRGWLRYATRGFSARADEVAGECWTATEHGGPDATVLVVGGGTKVRAACRGIPNAIYLDIDAPASRAAGTASNDEALQDEGPRNV